MHAWCSTEASSETHSPQPARKRSRPRCEHQRLHYQCVDCNGPSICQHARVRTQCRPCGGGAICPHNRCRSRCRHCMGGAICEHVRERRVCRECVGSGVCAHSQQRARCRTCSPVQYVMHLMRNRTGSMLRRSGAGKQHATVAYLGCSGSEFAQHIAAKMHAWNAAPENALPEQHMTLASIEIDHIKPCAAAGPEDIRDITHFTNTQPLLRQANRTKGDKWSEADDAFWRANISHNTAFCAIYWPLACQ